MKFLLKYILLIAIAISSSGCTEERKTIYQVDLGIEVSDRASINNVVLFFYDNENQLLGTQQGGRATWFDIEGYRSNGALNIVAWGNAIEDGVNLNSTERSVSLSDHRLVIEDSTTTFAGHRLSTTPPDLFFGSKEVAFVEQYDDRSIGNNRYIVGKIALKRVVASYAITVRNAVATFGTSDLTLLVRNPHSELNFSGDVVGAPSYSVIRSTYDAAKDELKTCAERALPTADSSLRIEIYDSEKLIYSTPDTMKLKLVPDNFHSIIIDLKNQSGGIEIIPSEWGDQSLDQIFN